jgi:hypothetical protein
MCGRAILMPNVRRAHDAAARPLRPQRRLDLKSVAAAVVVLSFSILSAVGAVRLATPRAGTAMAQWQEIAWPFPRDGWPAGRAFRCESCGGERGGVELYVRAKIGFCNCTTGVADDDEVDRVADLDLISARFSPREAGRAVHVAGLAGRSRVYDLAMPDGARHAAVGIALSQHCDLLVAVAQGSAAPAELQRAAFDTLGSHALHRWMMAALQPH